MRANPSFAGPAAFDNLDRLEDRVHYPRQMLDDQSYAGHASVHDAATADALGLAGAPIEGPTHFSQFDPWAFERWGNRWFEQGCLSAHFTTMVLDGEGVKAGIAPVSESLVRISATKLDGATVLSGTASIGRDEPTELDVRLAKNGEPGQFFVIDQLRVGQQSSSPETVSIDMETSNGPLYPFSLRQKLEVITEPSPWYSNDDTPWGRAVLPIEMISVLAGKSGSDFAVRQPSIGLFLDLEIRLERGPLFVGEQYVIEREIVALRESRRTESYWVRTSLSEVLTGDLAATVLLHSGVFKESFAGYPPERLRTPPAS